MNTKKEIDDFLAIKTLAIAGMSRSKDSMSASVRKDMDTRGYRLLLVNPNTKEIEGQPCYPSLLSLPEKVSGAIVLTPRAQSEQIVRDAHKAGIMKLWIQQGAESPAALAYCRENGIAAISGKCIMMFLEPVASFHAVHRWFAKLFGAYPK